MNDEKVMGVIPDLRTGLLGRDSFSLIVTQKRMIFAEYTTDLMKKERNKAVSKSESKGMMAKLNASVSSSFNFHNRYYDMDPEEILIESPNNYEIRPEQVKSIKIRSGQWDPESGKEAVNKMIIKWSGGKNKFNFTQMNPNQVKDLLLPLMGTKLK